MNSARSLRHLQWTLLGLVILLTFEGVARKLEINGTGIAIFLLKDVVVAGLGLQLIFLRQPVASDFIWRAYIAVTVFFIPVFISTLLHDPILAIFGLKQYLLYPIVGLSVIAAFEHSTVPEIASFFRKVALLVIPTAAVSFLELRLPPTHWLNLSVEGGTLANFTSGGHLRISSTFSFVAQYSSFLNLEIVATIVALVRWRQMGLILKLVFFSLVPLLFVSCYLTGSRGAVVGNFSVIAVAILLLMMRGELTTVFRVIGIALATLAVIATIQYFDADLFTTYTVREQGKLVGVSDEIQDRVYGSLFDWIGGSYNGPLLGYGLGIMSNGSDFFSDYAGIYRANGEWTETDIATTVFEGGPYLVLVWYLFRLYIVATTTMLFFSRVRGELSIPGGFCQGFVIIAGLIGTLGIQPPTAIWWWLCVGLAVTFWWKCVEPPRFDPDAEPAAVPVPVEPKKIRGRSAYAERLHSTRGRK